MATCLNPNAFACPHEYLWVFWSGTSGRNLRIKHDGPNSKRIITAYIAYRDLVQNILVIHPADITLTVGRPNFGCLGHANIAISRCSTRMWFQRVVQILHSMQGTILHLSSGFFQIGMINRNHPSRFERSGLFPITTKTCWLRFRSALDSFQPTNVRWIWEGH